MHNEGLRRLLGATAACVAIAFGAATPALAANGPATAPQADNTFEADQIVSFAGAFLAARVADADHDKKSAISFYRRALDFEPDNRQINERLMVTLFIEGDFDAGIRLAEQLKGDKDVDRITAIARGVDAFRKQQFASAKTIFASAGNNDLDHLMNGLLDAWARFGAGDKKAAQQAIADLDVPEELGIFKSYNAGLMAEAAGDDDSARTHYTATITDLNGGATAPDTYMRAVIALAEMEARDGNTKAALDAVATGDRFSPGYPPLDAVRQQIRQKNVRARSVTTARQGAATVFFSIGSALNRKGAEEVVSLYLHFSKALDPKNAVTRVMLGGIAEALNKPEQAISIYSGIPENSPMRRLSELQRGLDLARVGKTKQAKEQLRALIGDDRNDMRSYLALGSVLSNAKDYKAMAALYDRAAKIVGPVPQKSDWNIFFQRGIAYQQLKDWPKAEPNFHKALKLVPNQPEVLNFLGYSWIDRNIHLHDGLTMIKKAVSLRPNDGYIVDSLGWAYYKLGDFKKAVRQLEHAVELKPDDPTMNDHLGDAYWQVGRKTEAGYQWHRALTFKPDADQIPLIKAKIEKGLPEPVNGRPVNIQAGTKGDTPTRAPATSDSGKKSELTLPRLTRFALVSGAAQDAEPSIPVVRG